MAVLVLAACSPPWSPATQIEDLRLMAVKAEPPEIRPGETATLSALIQDPSRPGQATTTVWVGCDPDPYNEGRGACSDTSQLSSPQGLFSGGQLPPGIRIIGINDRAAYSVAPGLFDVLPEGDPRRITGTIGQLLAISVAEEVPLDASQEQLADVFRRVQDGSLRSLITLFRLRVSENPNRNHNPVFDWFGVDGEPHPIGGTVALQPAQKAWLLLGASPESFEAYQQTNPQGVVEDKTDRIIIAWYSTSGRFSEERIAIDTFVQEIFTAPGDPETPQDPVPERRTGTLWAVGRDSRGGVTWNDFPFFVCDASLPAPAVESQLLEGRTLTLRGPNLSSLLDVVVGGIAVPGSFSPVRNAWVGELPALIGDGTWPMVTVGRECSRREAGSVTVAP